MRHLQYKNLNDCASFTELLNTEHPVDLKALLDAGRIEKYSIPTEIGRASCRERV